VGGGAEEAQHLVGEIVGPGGASTRVAEMEQRRAAHRDQERREDRSVGLSH
jgi:hypothetical protein